MYLAKKYIVEANARKYPTAPRNGIPRICGCISVRHSMLDAIRRDFLAISAADRSVFCNKARAAAKA